MITKTIFHKFKEKIEEIVRSIIGTNSAERLFVWQMKIYLALNVKHIYGPKRIICRKNEAIVFCRVQNGELYIKSFVSHYFSLGVRHIIFLDNNSEDNTVALARQCKNVTILSVKSLLENNEAIFDNYVVRKFCKHKWCFKVDIDELVDYPFSNAINLKQLLDYLNANSYTAVVGQMLDMFSDKPLSKMSISSNALVSDLYRYYDIAHIRKYGYYECNKKGVNNFSNILENRDIKFYFGGIRDFIFNSDNGLSKHPIFFVHDKLCIIHPHCITNARCADISVVLFHYPFVNFFEKYRRYDEKNFGDIPECKKYLAKLNESPNLTIKQTTSQKLDSTNELIVNGFLTVSEKYLKFIDSHKDKN